MYDISVYTVNKDAVVISMIPAWTNFRQYLIEICIQTGHFNIVDYIDTLNQSLAAHNCKMNYRKCTPNLILQFKTQEDATEFLLRWG